MNVLVINCGSSSQAVVSQFGYRDVHGKGLARESSVTEDWFYQKAGCDKERNPGRPCQHIKKRSRWCWMHW